MTKGIRVVAWVFRYISNLKLTRVERQLTSDLTFEELRCASYQLIHSVQQHEITVEISALKEGRSIPKTSALARLTPFLGEDGLLHVQGRLQFSALSRAEKHPIISPRCHLSVLLVRFQHRLLKHAGVQQMMSSFRNEFWIIGLRRIAKRVKKACISWERQDAPACLQPMAPLLADRVNQAFPFEVTGLDHAGPLYCCDLPRKKFGVLLFTCAVARAVHIELVESLSTPETVLALPRFTT